MYGKPIQVNGRMIEKGVIKMKKAICAFVLLCLSVLSVFYPPANAGNVVPGQAVPTGTAVAAGTLDDVNTFDVNVKISIRVILDGRVKNINPDIIRAARQALFSMYVDRAKFAHYNNFDINDTMKIAEVTYRGNSRWDVIFNKDNISYSLVTVEKQQDGSYKGYIVYGNPCMRVGVTY